MQLFYIYLLFLSLPSFFLQGVIELGVDRLFSPNYEHLLLGQHVGLITNHTGINANGTSTLEIFKKNAINYGYSLDVIFAPEHGLNGAHHMEKDFGDSKDASGIIIYSLHGTTRRPTPAMLKNITLLVYDIQDIGSRSYTYISTLFYVMEEAAKARIPVIVLDRPNPMGGLLVDGPMLEEKWRSFVGYINVPYCHGMTIGELAQYFNGEYAIGCMLTVIPMVGWKRDMVFVDTGLTWIPTSPQIPEATTVFYYPTTGILGELQIVSIGVGYTLPFKVVGAPWINADDFARKLNAQKLPGVTFHPFHYQPFFGRFHGEECHGVLISINDPKHYLPISTQYLIIGMLKTLYPKQFKCALKESSDRKQMFNQINGTEEVYQLINEEKYVIWRLLAIHKNERQAYLIRRQPYLISYYESTSSSRSSELLKK